MTGPAPEVRWDGTQLYLRDHGGWQVEFLHDGTWFHQGHVDAIPADTPTVQLTAGVDRRPRWVGEDEMRWDMAEALGFELEDDAPPWSWLLRSARAANARTALQADRERLEAAFTRARVGLLQPPYDTQVRRMVSVAVAALPQSGVPGRIPVQGRCPNCRERTLFLAEGGRISCFATACDDPDLIRDMLAFPPAERQASEDALRDAVTDLLRRVGRMRDDWAESNKARQNELWQSVHTAAEHVGAVLDAENAQPWADELARLDRGSPLLPMTSLRKDTTRDHRDSPD